MSTVKRLDSTDRPDFESQLHCAELGQAWCTYTGLRAMELSERKYLKCQAINKQEQVELFGDIAN